MYISLEMITNKRLCSKWKNINTRKASREKKGVILITDIGFKINISMLKRYMSLFGKIERVFFVNKFSIRSFNSKKEKKAVGWIEFSDKKDAKQVAAFSKNKSLNCRNWENLKIDYLRNFEWQEIIRFFKENII